LEQCGEQATASAGTGWLASTGEDFQGRGRRIGCDAMHK
jgi:hypothetical protein